KNVLKVTTINRINSINTGSNPNNECIKTKELCGLLFRILIISIPLNDRPRTRSVRPKLEKYSSYITLLVVFNPSEKFVLSAILSFRELKSTYIIKGEQIKTTISIPFKPKVLYSATHNITAEINKAVLPFNKKQINNVTIATGSKFLFRRVNKKLQATGKITKVATIFLLASKKIRFSS
ncbi:hypothetical protein, partial [Enterobacter kobei]|uniref:hypothetical protein n=1 Tax=Enterobacter kobei TaxID=208224 RepID=UPI0019552D4A